MIIGVDPGKMTGFFIFGAANSAGITAYGDELPTIAATHEIFRWLSVHTGQHHIHAERFVMQAGKQTQQPDALEQIGALRWIADYLGATLTLHSRSERARITREQLVRVNWWASGHDHVNQAARCALLGLAIREPNHDLVQRAFGTI